MKSTTMFSLFLLFAFTSYPPLATADMVVDTNGEWIRNGGDYYILPVRRGWGGGLETATTGNETCPLTVVQTRDELSKGLPVSIASPYRIAYVYEGLILDIGFTAVPICAPLPSKWTIINGLSEEPVVKLTGYENTEKGWFHIEKAASPRDDFYKLVFCTIESGECGGIGTKIDDDGIRHLVVTENDPLLVQFLKVGSSAV